MKTRFDRRIVRKTPDRNHIAELFPAIEIHEFFDDVFQLFAVKRVFIIHIISSYHTINKGVFMKVILSVVCLMLSLSLCADDKMKEEMMKKWTEYSTPSEAHKFLATAAGKWSYTSKMWESKESKPEESRGTATMKMIMGGRYLQQEVKGKAMGQPFEGMGFTGYDNLKKRTNSTWMDNMGTAIMSGNGTLNMETKTISEEGEFTCPMEKDSTAKYRSEWVMTDKNNMTFTMFSTMEGKEEFKAMEMTYKRTK